MIVQISSVRMSEPVKQLNSDKREDVKEEEHQNENEDEGPEAACTEMVEEKQPLTGTCRRLRIKLTHNGIPNDFDSFPPRHDVHCSEDSQDAYVLNHLEKGTEVASGASFFDEVLQTN